MSRITTKRIYDTASADDGLRVLVDGVWPRGVSKQDAKIDYWAKDIAPSTELRKWFRHDPAKWNEFRKRYARELKSQTAELERLLEAAGDGPLTLLFGAKDTRHNQAVVLKEVLERMDAGGAR